MGKCAERIDPEELREKIRALDPEPFRDLLARVLAAEPSHEALKAFAEKHPDRWGQLAAIAAKPAGYGDKDRPRVEVNFYAQIAQMSDAELLTSLENWFRSMGMEPPALNELLGGAAGTSRPPRAISAPQENGPGQ